MALFGTVQVGDMVETKTGTHRVVRLESPVASDQDYMIVHYDNGGYDFEYYIDEREIRRQS